MTKPRVLIIISIQFTVRILIRSSFVKNIKRYVDPVIVLSYEDQNFQNELETMGLEVHLSKKNQYSNKHRHLKNKINYIWNKIFLQSFSISLDEDIEGALYPKTIFQMLLKSIIRLYWNIKYIALGQYVSLINEEEEIFFNNSNVISMEKQIVKYGIDLVMSLTPYNIHDEVILRITKKHNIPIFISYLSFDNIIAYGRVPVIAECYTLWNRFNKEQLLKAYSGASTSRIEIVGAPQFDFYYDETYLWEEQYWREKLSLPKERPVILFGAGFYKIVPNEHHWLKQLDDAIEDDEIKGNPIILFRIHPVDPIDRWEPVLKNAKNIVFDEPWKTDSIQKGSANIEKKDIEKLVSSLFHSSVHINASSTMTIDGSIFDRPQIGPAYDDMYDKKYDKIVKDLYRREHFIPIMKSEGLELAYSREELIKLINTAFENPTKLSSQRKTMVKEICTYFDGESINRIEEVFKSFLKSRGLI